MPRLVVVSNRVAVPDRADKASAGGLAVALRGAFQAYSGLWFGWSGRVAAEPDARPTIVDTDRVTYAVVDLTPRDRQEYYNGFANRALWPTMHYRIGLSDFSRSDYIGYRRVNHTFARALTSLIRCDDLVWVHDYHLIPLAEELRSLNIKNRIGYFHHIPWPAPEVFATLPGTKEILGSIAHYDLIGVQTERDAHNLRRSLVEDLNAAPHRGGEVQVNGKRLRIRSFPVGIDVNEFAQIATRARGARLVRQTIQSLGPRKLIIGVDRLDYSKGIPERMESYERFLLDNSHQRGRVTYLQIAPRSRSEVPEYAAISRAVNEVLGRINGSVGEPGWVPIHYVTNSFARSVLAGLYRLASIGLVTPMRDGMNLVAKEYVAAQEPTNPGVLILSKFAGAAQQLSAALIVNPNDKLEVAEAIRDALHMQLKERAARWQNMIERLCRQDVSWWAAAFLKELASDGFKENQGHAARRHRAVGHA